MTATTAVVRARFPDPDDGHDRVATEAPLEIRVDDEPLAVLMRTPGDDLALVAGFLCTEGVIDGRDDLAALGPCRDPGREHAENIVLVRLAAGLPPAGAGRLELARRRLYASASCGVCGKATIDAVLQTVSPLPAPPPLDADLIARLGDRVRATQVAFDATGGIHAAALFSLDDGALVGVAEDVGRHNAVDKVVGARLLDGAFPLAPSLLWISGRASFEVVQKAVVARVRALVAVGAPSSLAVEMARSANLTLVGFARGGARFNVYSGAVSDAR